MSDIKPGWLNQTDAAISSGVSVQAFLKWRVEPIYRSSKGVYYDVSCILQNRLANAERVKQKRAGKESDYGKEKARLTREQADSAEIKNAKARGELASIEVIEMTIGKVTAQMSSILETIPMQVKRRAPHLTATDVEIIKREITRIQNIAAEVTVDFDEFDDNT